MALICVNFFSEVLGMQMSCNVILPQRKQTRVDTESQSCIGKYPTLYLLHGMGRDHTTWVRNTSIERYVSGLGLAVVMPDANISFYANMAHGGRYFDFIADELPYVMRSFFPLSEAREDNFIAGQSMGGVGSLKIGLARSECFAAIGCLSATLPSLVMKERPDDDEDWKKYRFQIYGDQDTTGTVEDVVFSAQKIIQDRLPAPRIYHAWGNEDFILDDARETRDFFRTFPENPFDYTYEEGSGGHNWVFWDQYIQHFLKFLRLEKNEGTFF